MKQQGLRKLVSMILAVVMVLSMSITGFAATESVGDGTGTITITNAVSGETYSAYKMLNLSYNATTESYSYTVADGWDNFFADEDVAKFITVNDQGYVTSIYDETDTGVLVTIAKSALEYATENNISATASVVADENGVTITGLDLGYYLVDTTLGTLCSIDSTDTTAEIVEKNSTPSVDKQVQENSTEAWGESNTAGIGDTVDYKSTINGAANVSNLVYHDVMTKGLTFDSDSVAVKVGETTLTANEDYTVETEDLDDGCTFEVVFTKTGMAKITDDVAVVITYSATVNEDAVIAGDGNPNDAYVSYGNAGETKKAETITYVYNMQAFKYTTKDDTQVALEGAEFKLYKVVDGTKYYATVNLTNNYLTDWTESEDEATTMTSDVNGYISVQGLDAGTYYLVETKAPDGYNLLENPVEFAIEEDDGSMTQGETTDATAIGVENNAGSSLPSTGGMGTTIFYIVGGILVLGAAVLFVTKKRLGSEN